MTEDLIRHKDPEVSKFNIRHCVIKYFLSPRLTVPFGFHCT